MKELNTGEVQGAIDEMLGTKPNVECECGTTTTSKYKCLDCDRVYNDIGVCPNCGSSHTMPVEICTECSAEVDE